MILCCASWFAVVLNYRDKIEIDFCIPCRRGAVCKANVYAGEILNLILIKPDQAFLSNYLLLPKKYYIELVLNYHGMTVCIADHLLCPVVELSPNEGFIYRY